MWGRVEAAVGRRVCWWAAVVIALSGSAGSASGEAASCAERISARQAAALFEVVRERLDAPPVSAERDRPASPASGRHVERCTVFLTTSGGGRGFTTVGRGRTARAAVEHAVRGQRSRPPGAVRWQRLDFARVIEIGAPAGEGFEGIGPVEGLGVVGLATSPAFEVALHPEEILAYRMVDEAGGLRPSRARGFLDRFPHRSAAISKRREPTAATSSALLGPLPAFGVRFTVRSFAEVGGPTSRRASAEELFRGNRRDPGWRGQRVGPELRRHALAAGDYLLRNVGADGRFGYAFLPKTSRFADDYNILRHAGTVYSLFELHGASRDPALLAGGERALAYLRRQFRACPGAPKALCLVEDGEIKLGGNGLAILALLEHPDLDRRPELLADARRLAAGMVAMQQDDGRFVPHKLAWPSGDPDPLVSVYYPGEACFALARLATRTGERVWLDAAVSGVRYLIEIRDGGLADDELPHDHWLAYALRELEAHADDPAVASGHPDRRRYALRMARAISRSQNRSGRSLPQPDWAGGFYRPPRSAPTSTRMEGLVAIVEMLSARATAGRRTDVGDLGSTLCAATDYLLRTQLEPGGALYLAEPERVVGGFRRSLTQFQLRIDTSQHAISALLGMARLLEGGTIDCRRRPGRSAQRSDYSNSSRSTFDR